MAGVVVEVREARGFRDPRASQVSARCAELGLPAARIETSRLYRFEGDGWGGPQAEKAAAELLADPVTEVWSLAREGEVRPGASTVDVWYLPQVTDPSAESVAKGVKDLGLPEPARVRCGTRCVATGLTRAEAELLAEKVLANPVVHEWRIS